MKAARHWAWTLAGLAVLALAVVPFALRDHLEDAARFLTGSLRQAGSAGTVGYLILQFLISTTGILPASLLGIVAGVTYGFVWGSVFAFLGTMAGAIAGYYLGRRGFGSLPFAPLAWTRGLKHAQRFVVADGWRSVFLIRLSPVMPFAATSIALGATGLGQRDYLIGTAAALPALFGYVYAGSLLGGEASLFAPELHTVFVWTLAAGVIALVAVTARFIVHMKRAVPPESDDI